MPALCSVLLIGSLLLLGLVQSQCATELATKIPASPRLQTIVDGAVQQTLEKFASRKLEKDQLAVTLVDLTRLEQQAECAMDLGGIHGQAGVGRWLWLM